MADQPELKEVEELFGQHAAVASLEVASKSPHLLENALVYRFMRFDTVVPDGLHEDLFVCEVLHGVVD